MSLRILIRTKPSYIKKVPGRQRDMRYGNCSSLRQLAFTVHWADHNKNARRRAFSKFDHKFRGRSYIGPGAKVCGSYITCAVTAFNFLFPVLYEEDATWTRTDSNSSSDVSSVCHQ